MYSMVLMVAMTSSPAVPAGCVGSCTGGVVMSSGCFGSCIGDSGCRGGRMLGGFLGIRAHFARHRDGGCTGSSCYGSCSGMSAGCTGTVVHSGCYGSSTGGCTGMVVHSSCYGSCTGDSGCRGGRILGGFLGIRAHFARHRDGGCTGSSCYGSCVGMSAGCTGGCLGGTVVMPAVEPKKEEPKKMPEDKPTDKSKVGMSNGPATIVVSLPADAALNIDGSATKQAGDVRRFVTPELPAGRTFEYTLTASVIRDGKPVTVSEKITVEANGTTTVALNPTSVAVAAR